MKIAYIAAGAGGSYCGACARDATLVRGLLARGHEVLMLPLYTPLTIDGPDPSYRRVFYGGINTYLEEHVALFRHTPEALDRLLDWPRLLRRASRNAVSVAPERLGAMTVSVLRGPDGRQAKELRKLVRFLEGVRPDIVGLTNSLLAAVAPTIKEHLGAPVVCGLQGEEQFVEALGEPHRTEARDLIRRHAAAIDAFIAPGEAYADEMASFLAVERKRVHVVRMGIDLEMYAPAQAPSAGMRSPKMGSDPDEKTSRTSQSAGQTPFSATPFRVGYLSRAVPEKGLDILCEAFRLLARRRAGAVLAVAGQATAAERRFWDGLHEGLRRDGLAERVEYAGAVDLAGKVAFLQGLSVFVFPSRVPDPRGVAVLEALACGVPAVLPRGRGFEEVAELTGAVLVEPDDPGALADGLAALLDQPDEVQRLRLAARSGIAEHFSSTVMADRTLQVCQGVLSKTVTQDK